VRILVTRPKEDAEETAATLRARGHSVLIAPLIEIRFLEGPDISLDGIQAVLATSSNGVQALALRTMRRDVPLFAVGAQTARIARDAGFASVRSANGDARALAAETLVWAKPDAGVLLHAAGAETKGQLAEALGAAGLDVRTIALYDAVAVSTLPHEVVDALTKGNLDAVFLYSPRSAQIFSDCVVKARMVDRCAALTALCISPDAAARLASLDFRAVHVAPRPDQEALLALLG
jgi:uroporphyrinogen-III synthase